MSTRKLVSASFANLLIPISGLVVSPFLSRELGPDGRGLYAALTLPIVVYGWLGTYGLQDALTHHLRDARLSRRGALRVCLAAAPPLGVAGVALLSAVGLIVFVDDRAHYGQFLVLTLFAPVHILANLLIGALTGASDVTGVNLVKVVPALARTAVVLVACVAFQLNAYLAGLLFLASTIAGLVPGLVRLRQRGPTAGNDQPSGDTPPAAIPTRSLVRYSLACLPGVLAAISSARLDQIIGLPVIGAAQLGYYAVAVSVAEIPMVIATAARTVLMGQSAATDPREAARPARLAVLTSAIACALLAATAPVAVPWVFGDAFAPAVPPTVILCAGTTLYALVVILCATLLRDGRPGKSSASLVAGALTGVVLLLLLAPLGAVGAALASLAGYAVSLATAAWTLRHAPRRLRALTIAYPDDLGPLRDRLLGVRAVAVLVAGYRRAGPETMAAATLIVLAWLRVAVPSLVQMLVSGRPAFNAQAAPAPAADALGDAISLAFIAVAAALAAGGAHHRLRRSGPVGLRPRPHWPPAGLRRCVGPRRGDRTPRLAGLRRLDWSRELPGLRRPDRTPRLTGLRRLLIVLAPLATVGLAGVLNDQPPGIVSLALPLAAVAIWLRPPKPGVLAVIGILGAISAVGSMGMALVRPDLAVLSGAASGTKDGVLGGLLAGPYPHSNVLGISLALSLPFAFAIGDSTIRRGCTAVMPLAVYWSGSRTAQVAVFAVVLGYLLIRRWPDRLWPLSTMVVAGAALIIGVPLLTHDPEGFTRRGRIWLALLDRWTDQPLLGWGADYFLRPAVASDLGGQFNHGHNVMVHLLVVGGLLTAVLFAALLGVAWRGSLALLRAGRAAPALFVIALVQVSWLEASHLSTTLSGYLTWLPIMLAVRLGSSPPTQTGAPAPAPAPEDHSATPAQKTTVSRM